MPKVDELKTGERSNASGMDAEHERVSFHPEQQAKVQELIDEAYRKAYAKAQKMRGPEEIEKMKSEMEKLRQEKKMAMLLRSISRHNVVDSEEVAELLREKVRIDENGSVNVVGESGATRIDSSGRPISIDDFVTAWLGERPHHLRSFGSSGSGSQGARFSGGIKHDLADPYAWRTMPREELDRLLNEGVSVRGSSGQSYTFRNVKNPFLEARKRKTQIGG